MSNDYKHSDRIRPRDADKVSTQESSISTTFFEVLGARETDIEIYRQQAGHAEDSLEGALDERRKILEKTNISQFISKKIAIRLEAECNTHSRLYKAFAEDCKRLGFNHDKKEKLNYLEELTKIAFTFHMQGNYLIQQSGKYIVGPEQTSFFLQYMEEENAIIKEELEKLGIKKDHISRILSADNSNKANKCKEMITTHIVMDLDGDDLQNIINREVQYRLQQGNKVIKSAGKKMQSITELAKELTGEQMDAGITGKLVEKLRAGAEAKIRVEVEQEILGKALNIKPFDDGKGDDLSGGNEGPPAPRQPSLTGSGIGR